MRSKSFDTQEVKEIGRKKAGESRGFPIMWKGMRKPEEIKDLKKKIHARARKMLQHGIGNFVWASGGGKVGGIRKKFSERHRRARGRVRLHRARGSAELREVVFG